MKVQRKIVKGTLFVLAAGAALGLGVHFLDAGPAYASEHRAKAPEDAQRVARELSSAFEYSADAIRPSVVSIQATKHVKPAAQFQWGPLTGENLFPFNDQFLRHFFEGQLPQQDLTQQALGSGVIVDKSGYILTNNHVINGADELVVKLHDGSEVAAKVIGRDPASDLAVIKVNADNLQPAELGDSGELRVGEWVLAVGDPFGLSDTITSGIVSAKGRSNVHIAQYEDFIQTDAAINPGNSGGPLVDLDGRVVGINTAIASRTGGNMGVGFAIPINMAKTVMHSLIGTGHVTRGWLGIAIQALDPGLSKSFKYESTKGALVAQVENGSPADKAGIQQGDIITSFEGKPVANPSELRNQVADTAPGTKADLKVFRNGTEKQLTVRIGELNGETLAAATTSTRNQDTADELGLTVENLTPDMARKLGYSGAERGVVVNSVEPGSLAAEAGIQPKDVILNIQDKPVENVVQFEKELERHNLKDGVRLAIQSGTARHYVFLEQRES
jgi:serine protease Do